MSPTADPMTNFLRAYSGIPPIPPKGTETAPADQAAWADTLRHTFDATQHQWHHTHLLSSSDVFWMPKDLRTTLERAVANQFWWLMLRALDILTHANLPLTPPPDPEKSGSYWEKILSNYARSTCNLRGIGAGPIILRSMCQDLDMLVFIPSNGDRDAIFFFHRGMRAAGVMVRPTSAAMSNAFTDILAHHPTDCPTLHAMPRNYKGSGYLIQPTADPLASAQRRHLPSAYGCLSLDDLHHLDNILQRAADDLGIPSVPIRTVTPANANKILREGNLLVIPPDLLSSIRVDADGALHFGSAVMPVDLSNETAFISHVIRIATAQQNARATSDRP